MKYHLFTFLACSMLASAGFGQSADKLQQAFSLGAPANAGPIPMVSGGAFYVVDNLGNIVVPGRAGALKAVLTPATTVTFAPINGQRTFTLVPAQTETINATITNAIIGQAYYLVVTTSGTTSYTLTFGTSFKTTGTLATGTTSAKVFVMSFVFDGTNFNEVSRTSAM